MATDNGVLDVSFKAGADLSTKQFYLVYLDSSAKIQLCDGITRQAIGILQNKPDAADKEAVVRLMGISKIVLGVTLATGARISVAATGKAAAAASTSFNVGILTQGGVANDVGSVALIQGTANA